jgi:hypothetical protein
LVLLRDEPIRWDRLEYRRYDSRASVRDVIAVRTVLILSIRQRRIQLPSDRVRELQNSDGCNDLGCRVRHESGVRWMSRVLSCQGPRGKPWEKVCSPASTMRCVDLWCTLFIIDIHAPAARSVSALRLGILLGLAWRCRRKLKHAHHGGQPSNMNGDIQSETVFFSKFECVGSDACG